MVGAWIRKGGRVLGWLTATVALLLVAAILLLYTAPVQSLLSRQAEGYLQELLGSSVKIGGVGLQYPLALQLHSLHLPTPSGDSLLSVGELAVEVQLYPLFQQQVLIDQIILRQVDGRLINTDSSSNYQFLLDAFSSEEPASPAVDEDASGKEWGVQYNRGALSLHDITLYYQDDPASVQCNLHLGSVEIQTDTVDLLQQSFKLEEVIIGQANVLVQLQAEDTTTEPSAVDASASALQAACERLQVRESNIQFRTDSLHLEAQIDALIVDRLQAEVAEELNLRVNQTNLQSALLRYDLPGMPETPGLDPSHLQLEQAKLEVRDFAYVADSLNLVLEQLAFQEKSGFELTDFRTKVHYQSTAMTVEDLQLHTPASSLQAEELVYAFPKDSTSLYHSLDFTTEGQISIADLLLLAPQLQQYEWFRRHPNAELNLGLSLSGQDNALQATRLDVLLPGLRLISSGRLQQVNKPERLAGSIDLQYLSFFPEQLLPFLPKGSIPDYINWPQQIVTTGRLGYRNEQVRLDFSAQEERPQQKNWTQVSLNGTAAQVLDTERTELDIRLDSLLLTRPSILAYLPPKTIPAGYQLPNYLQASGSVLGPLDDLMLNLRLALPGNQTYVQVNGRVQEALAPEQVRFDISLDDIALRQNEIMALLPDSLLPAMLQLPDVRIQNGRLSGSPDDLQIHIPLESSSGNWLLDGHYQAEDLNLVLSAEQIQLEEWLQGGWRDSVARLDLQPLSLTAQVSGQLEPRLDLRLQTAVQEAERGQLLQVTASARDSNYQIDFGFTHPAVQGQGSAAYAIEDSLEQVMGILDLLALDLEYWGLSERPLSAQGQLSMNSNGLSTDQLEARFLLDDLLLRGGGSAAYVDSLLITANLLGGNNDIRISGDVLEGYVRGRFDAETIATELQQYFEAQLGGAAKEELLTNDHDLEMALRVKNPRPFTTGIIPALTALSEMEMSLDYQGQEPALHFNFDLPELAYAGLALNGMKMEAKGTADQLHSHVDWEDVTYGEDIDLGQTIISARTATEGLDVALQIFDSDSLRHYFALNWQQAGKAQFLQFKPEQRLNYQPWTVPANNQMRWQDSMLNITNWAFTQNGSSIKLSSSNEQDLVLQFQQFDLADISRIINTEVELIGGILDGELLVEDVLSSPMLALDAAIQQLTYYQDQLGDLQAQLRQQPNDDFAIDVQVEGAGNSLSANGLYLANNELDVLLQLNRLKLSSLEPFTLGYLRDPAGFLTGTCSVKGSADAPRLAGNLTFEDAELTVSLLGSRFLIDDQELTFNQELIQFDAFIMQDPSGNSAVMNGEIQLNSIEDIRLDLEANTRDFLAVSSTSADNDLFYGNLSVDAVADISGSVTNPRVVINATPSSDSKLTYAYSSAQQASLETTQDIVTFSETYEWEERLLFGQQDTGFVNTNYLGAYIETNLTINEKLVVEVLVDPITQQTFRGRGTGAITFIQRPNGQQELTGQISLANGSYDMVLEGLQRYQFLLEPGSSVIFNGDPFNPEIDLSIVNAVTTSPLPLVKTIDPTASAGGLRRRETFEVVLDLTGDLQGMDISADIRYPDDKYGNEGLSQVEAALEHLKQDQTRTYTTAITLVTLNSFVLPTLEAGINPQQDIVNGLAGAVGNALSNLVNDRLGGVEFDVGIENYETDSGEQNYNVRLSLQKSFFNDRLIVSVDGVTNTAGETDNTTTAATYLDNVSVAYLLDEDGNLRIKVFNDRDENVFVGGNVMRVGGRLVFSKDFDHFFWQKR